MEQRYHDLTSFVSQKVHFLRKRYIFYCKMLKKQKKPYLCTHIKDHTYAQNITIGLPCICDIFLEYNTSNWTKPTFSTSVFRKIHDICVCSLCIAFSVLCALTRIVYCYRSCVPICLVDGLPDVSHLHTATHGRQEILPPKTPHLFSGTNHPFYTLHDWCNMDG